MKPVHWSKLPEKQLQSSLAKQTYSNVRSLSEAFQLKHLLIHHETLLPGKQASAPHYHSHKEELIYLLEGEAIAIIGEEKHLMKAGDSIGFPPSNSPHQLINNSHKLVVYLTIGTCPENDQTIFT